MAEDSNRAQESPQQAEFRAYCRAWLDEHRPPPTKMPLPQAAYEVTAASTAPIWLTGRQNVMKPG